MVEEKFTQIPDKNQSKANWSHLHPFATPMKLVKMVPVMDLRSLTIRFATPDDDEHYKSDVSKVELLPVLKRGD